MLYAAMPFIRVAVLAVTVMTSLNSSAGIVYEHGDLPQYEDYVTALRNTVRASPDGRNLIVTLGAEALTDQLLSGETTPVLALLVTSANFARISDAFAAKNLAPVSAVFSDPDPALQVNLARRLSKNSRVLVANTPDSATRIEKGDSLVADASGVDVKTLPAGDTRTLLNLMNDYDVLVAVPDQTLYNVTSMQPIVSSLYRRQKFMIGFSKGMVNAGALAAISTDSNALAFQVDEIIETFYKTGTLPSPGHSLKFGVHINKVLSRSLNLSDTNEMKLARDLAAALEGQDE